MDSKYIETYTSQKARGTRKSNFTTAQSVLVDMNGAPFPGAFFEKGAKFEFRVAGLLEWTTGTPAFTFNFMIGSTIAWSSGAIAMPSTADTGVFVLKGTLRLDSDGATARLIGLAEFTMTPGTAAGVAKVVPTGAISAGTAWDSTTAYYSNMYVACSAANASNAVTVEDYDLKRVA